MLPLSAFDTYPQIPKAWGHEIVLCNTDKYCAKLLVLAGGKQCSLHKHLVKDETFFVLEGAITLEWGYKPERLVRAHLRPGEDFHCLPGTLHRFGSGAPAVILEVSSHHSDIDVERLEESGDVPSISSC